MPWALNELHDTISSARNTLDEMKAQMILSAERYIDQEAHVLALARILNQTALEAETEKSAQESTNNEGGESATET